ncbi:Crp/Fnr family transcriptional regulator [Streptomyces sp. NPDC002838]|uniref:Crp/Fnr family transcriptional regulator n=1 Tax=Streptomyces sp. NPDC002838 TaxID=3154436 RepID=UPI003331E569
MVNNASFCIVDVLSERQRAELEAQGSPVRFPVGHTIFLEGQPSRSVLVIQEGNVKITQRAEDKTEVLLAVRGPGEVMGDEGVLMQEPRSATVTTVTEVAGVDIAAADLLAFVEKHHLWPVMYRAAVRRRRESDQTSLLARLDVKSRLARWLVELVDDIGKREEEGWVISAALSQRDLASHIGASRDAVAIELRRLRELGVVTTGRRQIVVNDLDELRKIAES